MGADSAPIFFRNGMKVQYCSIRENYLSSQVLRLFCVFKGDAATITAVNKDVKEIRAYED